MQTLGVAAAPHAELLAGRLEDPHFQMRRACAETLRLVAEISKELALDRAEAEAEALKAAEAAEAALEAKREHDAELERAFLAGEAGARRPSRRASHRGASKVQIAEDVTDQDAADHEGHDLGHHSRSSSHQSHHSRRPSRQSHHSGHDGDHHHHHHHHHDGEGDHHHHHHHHHDMPPGHHDRREALEEPPKVHKAGWFCGKDHEDEHSDENAEEGEEGENGEGAKKHKHGHDHHGNHGDDSRMGSRRSVSKAADDAEGGELEEDRMASHASHPASHVSASDHEGSQAGSWKSSESSESEEEVITPRAAAAMADPRSAVAPFVPQLAAALTDDSWQVRLAAARALAAVGGEEVGEEAIVEAVLPVLSDVHEEVRCAAAEVLESVGAQASETYSVGAHAGEAIVKAITDPGESVRIQSIKAVAQMGRKVPAKCQHMKLLCRMMQEDESSDVRTEAAKAMSHAGRAGIHYVHQSLIAVMEDSCRWVKHAAMDSITNLGVAAVVQLAGAMECSDVEVRRTVVKHLGLCILELLEAEGDARKPVIAEKVKQKARAQEEHFIEMRRQREQHKRDKRIAALQARKEAGHDDSGSDESDKESEEEEGMAEDDMEEEANVELDATITGWVESIAAKLTDSDQQMRQVAIEALKQLQTVAEPHTGKQLLVWQEGRWQARLASGFF